MKILLAIILLFAVTARSQLLFNALLTQPAPAGGGGGGGSANNVVYDTNTQANFTTADPFTTTHSPVGVPRGVLILIAQSISATDHIDGEVKYGTATLSRVFTAADTDSEPRRVYAYFLGSGIPTGPQTVSIDHDGSSDAKTVAIITLTADGDTSVATFGTIEEDFANPQLALDTASDEALRFCVISSGWSEVTSLVPLDGMTEIGTRDNGANVFRFDRQTTKSSGSFTIGYNDGGTEDVAFGALAIK